jgi:hypothetical protein
MSRPPFPPLPAPSPPRAERNPHEQRGVTVSRAGLPANPLLELDLDDGVKVNHLKLAEVLAPIPERAAKEDE